MQRVNSQCKQHKLIQFRALKLTQKGEKRLLSSIYHLSDYFLWNYLPEGQAKTLNIKRESTGQHLNHFCHWFLCLETDTEASSITNTGWSPCNADMAAKTFREIFFFWILTYKAKSQHCHPKKVHFIVKLDLWWMPNSCLTVHVQGWSVLQNSLQKSVSILHLRTERFSTVASTLTTWPE